MKLTPEQQAVLDSVVSQTPKKPKTKAEKCQSVIGIIFFYTYCLLVVWHYNFNGPDLAATIGTIGLSISLIALIAIPMVMFAMYKLVTSNGPQFKERFLFMVIKSDAIKKRAHRITVGFVYVPIFLVSSISENVWLLALVGLHFVADMIVYNTIKNAAMAALNKKVLDVELDPETQDNDSSLGS